MRKAFISLATLALISSQSIAKENEEAPAGPQVCPRLQAQTVFVADKTGSRQKGSASKLSEAHQKAENLGWDFSDLEVYIEDGDLQGFFVTYTRPHPCNQGR